MIVLLRAEGRRFLCACGHFAVWVGDMCSSNTSQQLLDPYSFTHVLHGFLFFWLIALLFRRMPRGWQFWLALLLESAWEVFENTSFVINKYRTETAALGYHGRHDRQLVWRSRLCAGRVSYRTKARRAPFVDCVRVDRGGLNILDSRQSVATDLDAGATGGSDQVVADVPAMIGRRSIVGGLRGQSRFDGCTSRYVSL